MSVFKTRDELRAEARRRGMVNAAAGDVEAMDQGPHPRNSARHRVGASVMRELGIGDDQIVAKYGYLPDPLDQATLRNPAA